MHAQPPVKDLDTWAPWSPVEVAHRLRSCAAPWYVAGGWAIDLHLGRQRRDHDDTEIAVPAVRFDELAATLGAAIAFFVPDVDGAWPLHDAPGRLADRHQAWARDARGGPWRLDVFREPSIDGQWVCRRDEQLRLPYDQLVLRTSDGIPYSDPAVVLLFKAKHVRNKDERDFVDLLPSLEPQRRRWLANVLEAIHPGHAWIGRLAGAD